METPKILIEIRSKYREMNPAMKRVADFMMENYDQSVYMGLSEIAQRSKVSDASVTRFIRRIGFKNFKSFQVEIAKSLLAEDKEKSVYGGAVAGDSVQTICEKIFNSNIQILRDTLNILDFKVVEKVSDLVLHARNVIFFSQGRSSVTSRSGRLRFYRLGISCTSYSDPHEQAVASCMVGPGDVVIGISNYGRSASVLRNLTRSRENGAKTVGITSAQNSPLTACADYVLYSAVNTGDQQQNVFEPSCENLAQIAILDCIYMTILLREPKKAMEGFYKTSKALDEERI
ncbi:MAG: MurR/RpiR family transcriptional regulator [Oscillospiraceae bacterium]|nr:MurR/RpiR family transcriptional regulator [Oscillospiraceae bacterium]